MSPYRFAFVAVLVSVACGGKIDPNASEKTSTRQVGTGNGGSSSSSSSSGVVGTPPSKGGGGGPCSGAGLIPFEEDFEDGVIGDGFTVNSPSAFSIEWDEPINGSASLRVKPNKASYLSRKVKSACAARLQFTLRGSEDFIKSGGTIARIDAGSRKFTLSIVPGGALSYYEEVTSPGAGGGGGPGALGNVFAEDPTVFVLDVDLSSSKVTLGFKSMKSPGPTKVFDMAPLPPEPPPAITSIELGTTPGVASDPQGLYFLDDISID